MRNFLLKNMYTIVLGLIFLLAFFLRAYRLTEIPNIVHLDEASLGYNAWCLAHYGVDRYFNQMPLYAQNLNGGQSPLYTYFVVLLIKTIGHGDLSLLLVRLPGFIFSSLLVLVGTKSMSLIFHSKKVTLMSALLLAVCPYYIMHGRFALDCNLMLTCSAIALFLLARYICSNKLKDLVLCGISFGIVLYSYALSYFVIPLFLIFICLYMLYTRKITFRRVIILAFCVCITALPVILFACSLLFHFEPFQFLWFTISPVASARMADIASTNFFENIADIIKITLTYSFYPLDALDKYYTMYAISIPFIVIGILVSCKNFFHSLKKRYFDFSSIYLLFYLFSLVTIGLTGTHYVYRANYFFISYLYFLVIGIYTVYQFVRSYRRVFICTLCACYLVWSLSFFRYYFQVFSMADTYIYPNSLYFTSAEEPFSYAQNQLNVEDIYIDAIGMEEYHCFFNPISPYKKKELQHEDGYGHYHFEINYDTPIEPSNAYIVHKQNNKFIAQLNNSGISFATVEYPYYYLFYSQ